MWRSPFISITSCLIAGILIAPKISYVNCICLLCILLAGFAICDLRKKTHRSSHIWLLCALIIAGSLRYHLTSSFIRSNHIVFENQAEISAFYGKIIRVHSGANMLNRYIIALRTIRQKYGYKKVSGSVLLYTKKIKQKYDYGNMIEVRSAFQTPGPVRNPGQFSYREYLVRQDIYHICRVEADSLIRLREPATTWSIMLQIEKIRAYIQGAFDHYLDLESSALAHALILGEKQLLDKEIVNRFRRTGVVHVLAISGLHVGFIIAFVVAIASVLQLSPRSRFLFLGGVLCIYVILVDFRPPVVRASLMALIVLGAEQLQRKVNYYNIIFAAAAVILLIDPRELSNPGFQFSFCAVLAIISVTKYVRDHFPLKEYIKNSAFKRKLYRFILIPFVVSLGATAGTAALTWYYYGMLPVYTIIANLLVIPLTGILVLIAIFILIISMFSEYLTSGLAGIFSSVYGLLKSVILFFSNLPLAAIELPQPPVSVVLFLLLSVFIFFHLAQLRYRYLPLIAALLVILGFLHLPRVYKNLQVSFLDVGQGDCAILRFPNGKVMIVDSGDRSQNYDHGQQTVLPFLKKTGLMHVHYLVISHPHHDHIGGMSSLLSAVTVDTVVTTAYVYKTNTYQSLLNACISNNIKVKYVEKGNTINADQNCRVYILHPDSCFIRQSRQDGHSCNNASLVIKVQYGYNRILLTGDIERDAENHLHVYQEFLQCELLKIGHHGSITSTHIPFLNQIRPIISVISVAEKNKFKHPSPIVINRLVESTPRVYQTQHHGALQFEITPKTIKKIEWADGGNK